MNRGLRSALVAALFLAGCHDEPAPPPPSPPPPTVTAPSLPPVVDAGASAIDTGVDAGPPDAGPVDAGPADAGPADAGTLQVPPAAGRGDAAANVAVHPAKALAADAQSALDRPMRSCFRQAEKIHWGPQLVVLKGTIAAKDGLGGIDDGAVVENSLHDADSNACFLAAVAAARFTLKPEDVGQSKNFRFQHVPKVQ